MQWEKSFSFSVMPTREPYDFKEQCNLAHSVNNLSLASLNFSDLNKCGGGIETTHFMDILINRFQNLSHFGYRQAVKCPLVFCIPASVELI